MTQLNEIKRMQLLAGILTESQLDEAADATPEAQKITAYLKNLKLNGEMGKGLSLDKVLAPEVNYVVSLENMASGIQAFVYFKNDAKGQELAKEIQKSYGGDYSQSFAQGKVVGVTNIGSNPTTESQLNEKMSYDDFEQMIKPFIDLAKSKGWIWNSSGDSWFEVGSPAIALYHSTELPTTADGEYKGQKMLASKDVTIGGQVQSYGGDIKNKQADVIMQSDYNMDQAYFQSKDKAILDAIKSSMANVTDVVEDTKESSSPLTTSKSFEPVKYYYMVLRKKQAAPQAESTESQLDEEKMDEMNSEWEKEIWKVLKAKFDLDPTTATIKFGPNGMSIKPVDYRVWADKFTKGRQTGGNNNNNIDAKADKIAAYFNKKYGKNIVAESLDPLDEVINNALKAAGIK
jgi:hypothetical protein